MDTRTGEILSWEEVERRIQEDPMCDEYFKPVPEQPLRKKTGRNEPCPCGSGRKFKRCCLT
jgi:uncharacterized protein YecA (UPF0149 family)